MKRKIIIVISWILVFTWMGVIFYFSSMNGEESKNMSVKTIETTIKKTVEKTNEVGITNKNPDSKKIEQVAEKANFPIRKTMHAFEYFILTLLLINALYQSGLKGNKIFILALTACFLYACTDEFHQSFTSRTPSFIDVLIDTFGGIISIILIKLIIKIKSRKNIRST